VLFEPDFFMLEFMKFKVVLFIRANRFFELEINFQITN